MQNERCEQLFKKRHKRNYYSQCFKIAVVRYALTLPVNARIKPTSRMFGVQPNQIRNWIKKIAASQSQTDAIATELLLLSASHS